MGSSSILRRQFLIAGASLASLLVSREAKAETYPDRTVKVIVPFPAGGSLDTLSRGVVQKLEDRFSQPFVVENRAGANGQIGTASVARATPNGYTILTTTDGAFSIPSLSSKPSYDTLKDFIPLSMMCELSFLLVSNLAFPPNTLAEMITYVKARPDKVDYASPGVGSQHHLAMERFSQEAGLKMLNVPYPGASQMVTGILGEQVSLMIAGVANSLELVRAGKLKAIAYAGRERHPLLPDVPTFSEAGMPGFEARAWMGAFAPAGTPADAVKTLQDAIWEIVNKRDFTDRMLNSLGFDPSPSVPPDRFAAFLRDDRARYEKLLQQLDLKPVQR